MKFEKNTKYNTMALLAVLVVAFGALLISLAIHFDAVRGILANILSVLAPLIYSLIIVLILLPVVDFFELKFRKLLHKMKNYRKKASALALLCTYLLFFSVVALSVSILVSQAVTLYNFALNFVDEYLPALTKFVNEISKEYETFGEILMPAFDSLKTVLTESLSNLPNVAVSIASALGELISLLSDWLLAVIISVYALLRRRKLKAMLRKMNAALFEENLGGSISRACNMFYKNLVAFFSAKAYNMLIVGFVYSVLFYIMGLKFFSAIALIIAVCSLVPIFGMLIGGGIGAFIVLATDTPLILPFIVVFFAVFILDYLLVQPRVTKPAVRVSLGVSMCCVLVGFFFWKILGALFAIPVYVTARDIIIKWYKRKKEQKVTNSAEAEE